MGGEAHRYYLRRDGMQSISPEGGVGGRVLLTRQGREREREREREGERERERERERETITTKGGVGGGCNGKRYWLM